MIPASSPPLDPPAYPNTVNLLTRPALTGEIPRLGRSFVVNGVGDRGSLGAPVAGVRCGVDEGPWRECGFGAPILYLENVPPGPHVLRAAAYDVDGLQDPTPLEVPVTVDWVGPAGTALINGGAATAGRRLWHVDMPATDDDRVERATISRNPPDENGLLTDGIGYSMDAWRNGGFTFQYDDPGGGSTAPGLKTIWIQWYDYLGNPSDVVSEQITYDPDRQPTSAWHIRVSEDPVPLGKPVFLHAQLVVSDGVRASEGQTHLTIDGRPDLDQTSVGTRPSVGGINTEFLPDRPGTYTARYRYDGGGGVLPSERTFTFTVGPDLDQRPPDTLMDGLPPDSANPNQVTRTLTGVRAASLECSIDDAPWAPCTTPWTTPLLPDGLHVISARAVSAAGIADPTPDRDAVFLGAQRAPGSVYPAGTGRRVMSAVVPINAFGPWDSDILRLSASAAVGPDGRLLSGLDVPIDGQNAYSYVSWNIVDPAYGGTPGDGDKEIVAQWLQADGTWTKAVAWSIELDLTPPSLRVLVDNSPGFVDDSSSLYVILETTGHEGWFSVSTAPGNLGTSQPVPQDGIAALVVPIEPVPPGTVAERTVTAFINTYYTDSERVSVTVVVDRSIVPSDRTAPTPVVSAVPAGPGTNAASLAVAVDFGEPVAGFSLAGVSVGGTSTGWLASGLSGSGARYTLTVSAASPPDGTLTVMVPAGAASDLAGNTSLVSSVLTLAIDRTAPRATLTAPASPTAAAPLAYTLTFGEPVTGLAASDFTRTGTATGCVVETPRGSDAAWTVDVTGCREGTVALGLDRNGVADLAGNSGPADPAAAKTVTIDRTGSTAVLACTPTPGFTNAASLACSVNFTEEPGPGSTFTTGDILVGGTAKGWTAGGPVGTGAGPYAFTLTSAGTDGSLTAAVVAGAVTDGAGNPTTASATLAWRIDRTAPTTTTPSVTPRTGVALAGSAVPVVVAWTGSDAGGAGVASYRLERSTDGGTTWTIVSAALTPTTYATTVPSSGTVRYRVRAIDRAGNTSAPKTGLVLTPRLTQQTSTAIRRYRTWTTYRSSAYSGGSVRSSKTAGAYASYTFTGRSIAFVTTKAASRGKVKVYVNGVYQATVNLSRSATQYRSVAWQRTFSTSASRTIKIVVVGTRGRPRVDLDAFIVVK